MSKSRDALKDLRNIGIIAHIDAGKTTLSERILFYTQKIHRMGEVHNGTATMDFMPEEQERGITIAAATTSCQWGNFLINLIDTPGHVDFTIEVERSLRVLDGAIGVFCAVGGVEPQSETVWRQSEELSVPKIAFINKMDRIGANFFAVLDAMRTRLHANPVAFQIPLGEGETFYGIVDLISMQRLDFSPDDQGKTINRLTLTPEEESLAAPWREKMLDTLAENDESFLDKYLSDEYNESDIHASARQCTLQRLVTPVFVGSALKNTGIQPVMDAVCRYLPSPLDVEPLSVLPQDKDPLQEKPLGLIFKVLLEGGRKISLLRVYEGTIKEGDNLRNISRSTDERVSRIYRLHADHRDQLPEAKAGEIVAVMGLKTAKTGDTVGAHGETRILENLVTYQPVISLAFEPRNTEEGKVLDEALERYTLEDPTLQVALDEGSGHRIVSGMGELHLEVLQERIQREYNIAPRTGNPQVVTHETISTSAEAQGIFERELGTVQHHGDVTLSVSPRERGTNSVVLLSEQLIKSQENPAERIPPILVENAIQGVHDSLFSGPLTGYPVQDVEVIITALNRKEGISTPAGFHMAAGIALRDALAKAGGLVLQPIMNVEISVPEEGLGSAINLFNTCGGRVEQLFDRAGLKVVQGLAPMRQLFGFSTKLRSSTQGRAGLMMRFETYDAG